jgi:RNA polymerase sigma-70 factor, ECF subfamily
MLNGSDFARIYEEHVADVRRTAASVLGDTALADDVAQEVFLTVWRGCRYDPTRGPLGPYLRLMARSRALDLWRRNRVAERATDRLKQSAVLDPSTADEPSRALVRAAERESARRAVRNLPAPQRQAIGLTYWGGLTTQQAADATGIPLGTVKSRVRLALHKLAQDPSMVAA